MCKFSNVICFLYLLHTALAVKVKLVMHSDAEDSKMDEDETQRPEPVWEYTHKKQPVTVTPIVKKYDKKQNDDDDETRATTEKKPTKLHPNDIIFPLIYKQSHINTMFKYGDNWYTWSIEKRTDGTKSVLYYICYEEPKKCDESGWEHTDGPPKCAVQIESLLSDDRACVNTFGVEVHSVDLCDGAEQMKVNELVRTCGPRIRSLWRFVRVGPRPAGADKPADVNSLICEDEEECFVTIEYRIHHDRISFSIHEPTRGQTFKSALKRDVPNEEDNKLTTVIVTEASRRKESHRSKKRKEKDDKKYKSKIRSKFIEGKGIIKERSDAYLNKRGAKNKIKIKEDVSEDISE